MVKDSPDTKRFFPKDIMMVQKQLNLLTTLQGSLKNSCTSDQFEVNFLLRRKFTFKPIQCMLFSEKLCKSSLKKFNSLLYFITVAFEICLKVNWYLDYHIIVIKFPFQAFAFIRMDTHPSTGRVKITTR